jgi:predicted ArsR family transcriptional regulator
MSIKATGSTEPKTRKLPAAKSAGHSARNRDLTRKAQLLRQLSRKTGTDVPTLCESFGWQPHTARAALSGLRKAGYDVIREAVRDGRPARYRLPKTSSRDTSDSSVGGTVPNAG